MYFLSVYPLYLYTAWSHIKYKKCITKGNTHHITTIVNMYYHCNSGLRSSHGSASLPYPYKLNINSHNNIRRMQWVNETHKR